MGKQSHLLGIPVEGQTEEDRDAPGHEAEADGRRVAPEQGCPPLYSGRPPPVAPGHVTFADGKVAVGGQQGDEKDRGVFG